MGVDFEGVVSIVVEVKIGRLIRVCDLCNFVLGSLGVFDGVRKMWIYFMKMSIERMIFKNKELEKYLEMFGWFINRNVRFLVYIDC